MDKLKKTTKKMFGTLKPRSLKVEKLVQKFEKWNMYSTQNNDNYYYLKNLNKRWIYFQF